MFLRPTAKQTPTGEHVWNALPAACDQSAGAACRRTPRGRRKRKAPRSRTGIHAHTHSTHSMTPTGASAWSFLGLLLCSHLLPPVSSIRCFVCSSSPTNEQCNLNNQTCQQPLDTCMTIIDILGSSKAIVKQCASRATCLGATSSAGVDQDGNGNIVNCCNTNDLCNVSGADAVHAHMAPLALCLGSLLLVVR